VAVGRNTISIINLSLNEFETVQRAFRMNSYPVLLNRNKIVKPRNPSGIHPSPQDDAAGCGMRLPLSGYAHDSIFIYLLMVPVLQD
jgi:hypothetical protein